MFRRFGIPGFLEYRRYSCGAYLIVGRKWFTLK
jgi:hypothetical protein